MFECIVKCKAILNILTRQPEHCKWLLWHSLAVKVETGTAVQII